jgi:hypothetical protein
MQATAEMEDLYARQSRHSQFADAAERDAALRQQIKAAKAAAEAKRRSARQVEVLLLNHICVIVYAVVFGVQ